MITLFKTNFIVMTSAMTGITFVLTSDTCRHKHLFVPPGQHLCWLVKCISSHLVYSMSTLKIALVKSKWWLWLHQWRRRRKGVRVWLYCGVPGLVLQVWRCHLPLFIYVFMYLFMYLFVCLCIYLFMYLFKRGEDFFF